MRWMLQHERVSLCNPSKQAALGNCCHAIIISKRAYGFKRIHCRPNLIVSERSKCVASAKLATDTSQASSLEIDGPACMQPVVQVDNQVDPQHTVLTIEALDYPGLLRTVTWVLNGLGVRVQNAILKTEHGVAKDYFQLVDLKQCKLSDDMADSLAERLLDFVLSCAPDPKNQEQEWGCGDMMISNIDHPTQTVLIITGEPARAGFLLEVASIISGVGAIIHEAVIQGEPHFEPAVARKNHNFAHKGRVLKFWLTDGDGTKLNPGRVSSLLYTLDLVAGQGYMPTRAPNMDTLLKHSDNMCPFNDE